MLAAGRRRLDAANAAAAVAIRARLTRASRRLERLSAALVELSPLQVLERGYAIVTNSTGIVRASTQAPPNTEIHVRLHDGELRAVVRPAGQAPKKRRTKHSSE
jgi:exodeoxyribonuclease VII large subunit